MYIISTTLYLLMCITTLVTLTQSLKFCIVKGIHTGEIIEHNCQQVKNDAIDCVIASDRIECLRIIVSGKADFAVFEPEDLFASLSFNEAHILITHELRLFPNDTSDYEMILLISNGINSIADLYGTKFCHPGYNTIDNDWTPIFSNYLQSQIMPKRCEQSLTLLENRFAALSEWFKAACYPSVWTSSTDKIVDQKLKSKYFNLCAICDNGACHTGDKYHGRSGAVMCLTENAGDVGWVRLVDAQNYFKMANIDTSKYKIMCPDGMVRNLNNWDEPCTWITRPWPVVGARSDMAERVANVIDGLIQPKKQWQILLLQLLEAYKATPVKTDTLKTPEDFLQQFTGLSSAYARSTCYPSRIIKWCLSSNLEDRKCQWLRHAALSIGLEPEISCLQQAGRNASIEGVERGSCDFYIGQPEDLMTAREKNLTVATEFIGTYLKHFNNIVVLVKKESRYQRIEDLRGATACFSKYRSVAWNAFFAVMSNQTNDPIWRCSDGKAMSTFFKSIVFPKPDVKDEEINVKTFECLTSGNGDVAFVTLDKKFRTHPGLRRICVEEVFDPECILTWSTLGSVMVNVNLPQVRRREIIQFLDEMNTWFGAHYPRPTPSITLYAPYDTHHNVIFPELAVELVQNVSYSQLSRPYTEILKQLSRGENHFATCGARSINLSIDILILLIFVMLGG